MNRLGMTAACACLCACAFADDTMTDTYFYGGTLWSNPARWVSGTIPNGVGVGIDTGAGSPTIRMDATNRTVGAITTTRGAMPSSGGEFTYTLVNEGVANPDATAPHGIWGPGFAMPTNVFTFANGVEPAEIRIDDGAVEEADGTPRQPYRYYIDVPVCLGSDLKIRHLFASVNSLGVYTTGTEAGAAVGVVFSRPITGEKGITIENKSSVMAVAFGADNAFTGDLTVRRGIARAMDADGQPRVGTPFGRDNTVSAEGDGSGVDLGGFTTGRGQVLRLKGKRTDGGAENGVLFSTWARPGDLADWQGDVVLADDTWIGGTLTKAAWDGFYPVTTHGALAVSGPIGEENGPAAVHIVNQADTVFGGTNTFSGGLVLENGSQFRARCAESFGTGPVKLNGGVYRFLADDDGNISEANVTDASGGFRVYVGEGATMDLMGDAEYKVPANGILYKYGPGTLRFDHWVNSANWPYVYGGTLLFDTSKNGYPKLGDGDNNWGCSYVQVFNDVSIHVVGDPEQSNWAAFYGYAADGFGMNVRVEDKQKLFFSLENNDQVAGYANFEDDGSGAFVQNNKSPDAHVYDGACSFIVYNRRSWVGTAGGVSQPVPDSAYVTDWTASTAASLVDVSADNASVPADAVADCLRFNTPNVGSELLVTLAGDLKLDGHTILVTPEMGDTPVRITGGAIKSSGIVRILNFNTNATLTIESDIASSGNAVKLVAGGPGKTVLVGAKSFGHQVYVIGGELQGTCAASFGTADASWDSGKVFLSNGGIVSFTGTVDIGMDSAGRWNAGFDVIVSSSGGGIGVANAGDTFTLSRSNIQVLGGGLFTKTGDGTFVLARDSQIGGGSEGGYNPGYVRTAYLGGSVVANGSFSQDPERMEARGDVTLVGSRWLNAFQPGTGGGNRRELQGKRALVVGEGGVTVDLKGQTTSLNDINTHYGLDKSTPYFGGTGELKVVDTTGGAALRPNGFFDGCFRGTFTSYVPMNGDNGFQLPNATFCVPAGVMHSFGGISEDRYRLRFGRLTGSGTLTAEAPQSFVASGFYVGQDGVADADFAGALSLKYGAGSCGALRLIKIGDNAQRLSGAANQLEGHTLVRAGALLVGNDSSAGSGASGALGQGMVYVGDGETPDASEPALLIDGAYTVANEIRVHATSPASALPKLGGTAAAGGATFTGPVTLYRNAAFHAEAGTTVEFAGVVSGEGAIVKTGAGKVVLSGSGAVTLAGVAGGLLETAGDVTIADGATLDLSGVDFASLTEKAYPIITCGGALTGSFAAIRGLPENGDWKIRVTPHGVKLVQTSGAALIIR